MNKEIKWLYDITNTKKRYIVILVFLQTILSVSGVIYALLLRNAIDEATAGNRDGFFLHVGLIVGVVIVQIALVALGRYLEEYMRSCLENACKLRLFRNLLKKDFETVTNVHSAEWLNRLTSDTAVCANGIVEILPRMTGLVVKMVSAFAMIIVLEPNFIWILVPGGLVALILTYAFRKTMKRLHKEMQEKDGHLRALLQEHISSLLILKAFTAERQSSLEADERMHTHQKARIRRVNFSNICNTGFSIAMNGIYLIGGVGYCGYGIFTGNVSYGTFTAILQLIGQIQSPFANITGFLPRYYAMIASAERLMEAETFREDCPNGLKEFTEVEKYYADSFERIELEKIGFTYRPLDGCEEPTVVLSGLDLNIHKGDYVALTGQSGCGSWRPGCSPPCDVLPRCAYPRRRGSGRSCAAWRCGPRSGRTYPRRSSGRNGTGTQCSDPWCRIRTGCTPPPWCPSVWPSPPRRYRRSGEAPGYAGPFL